MQENGAVIPKRVHTVVISVQHDDNVSLEDQRRVLKEKVIKAVIPAKYLDEDTIYHLQPSGRFVIGGPQVNNYIFQSIIGSLSTLLQSMTLLIIKFKLFLKHFHHMYTT